MSGMILQLCKRECYLFFRAVGAGKVSKTEVQKCTLRNIAFLLAPSSVHLMKPARAPLTSDAPVLSSGQAHSTRFYRRTALRVLVMRDHEFARDLRVGRRPRRVETFGDCQRSSHDCGPNSPNTKW